MYSFSRIKIVIFTISILLFVAVGLYPDSSLENLPPIYYGTYSYYDLQNQSSQYNYQSYNVQNQSNQYNYQNYDQQNYSNQYIYYNYDQQDQSSQQNYQYDYQAENDNVESFFMIILKSADSIPKVKAMCNVDNQETSQQHHEMITAGINAENVQNCSWQGQCTHVFQSAIQGVYGLFNLDELRTVGDLCLKDEIDYVEGDQSVFRVGSQSDQPVGINNRNLRLLLSRNPNIVHVQSESIFTESAIIQIPDTVSTEKPEELDEVAMQTDSFLSSLEGEMTNPLVIQDQIAISKIIGSPGYKTWPLPEGLWNLDRVDQRGLPLNDVFLFGGDGYVGTGRGVTIYVVDTGIRSTHIEFYDWELQQSRVGPGYDSVDLDFDASDCDGHGTHVASVAVGRGVGIAKEADVVGVRVLNCTGAGFTGSVVAGLDWIALNVKKPAIITLSLGLDRTAHSTKALEDTIRKLVRDGVVVVVASGNGAQNTLSSLSACNISPAHMEEVITVGASNLEHKFGQKRRLDSVEGIYRFGNTGKCVDLFAPGVDIYAACGGEGRCSDVRDVSYIWQSGTSMAVPHVAAAAAIFMGEVGQVAPEVVKEVLLRTATKGVIDDPLMMQKTTDKLLYINIDEMMYQYEQTLK